MIWYPVIWVFRFLKRLLLFPRPQKPRTWGHFGLLGFEADESLCTVCGGFGAVQEISRMNLHGDKVMWQTDIAPCKTCGENYGYKKLRKQAENEVRFRKNDSYGWYTQTDVASLEVSNVERKDKKAE